MGNYAKKYKDNTKIGVLYGGMSSEREVSLRSGKNVSEALKRQGYKNVLLIDVDKNLAENLKKNEIEVAYNALHGKYGEDGCVQGILEILGIEYTGCGVMASAITMNKEYTKRILSTNKDIIMAKSAFIKKGEDIYEKTKDLKYPLFVKPVSEGSSFGMTKANTKEELKPAYDIALKYNKDVLIEEFIDGFFVTVGVLEKDNKPFATEILEIRPKTEWYDFEAKYTKGMSDFIVPANLNKEVTNRVKDMAVKAFETTGCKGVSRIDFMMKDNVPYLLEINTSPGMTDISDLPAQAKACGISYDELVLLILNNAGLNR